MKTALIDADSVIYIIAYQYRETEEEPYPEVEIVQGATDEFIKGILQATDAERYLGAIGHDSKCFRYEVAKFKPYKGGRKEPDPWVAKWKKVITDRMRSEWGFTSIDGLEADDIISIAADQERVASNVEVTICSPDKDLRQIPGVHYDYKKQDFAIVDDKTAYYNLWYQMIVGDSTDGIAGIPGMGPKKALEKMKEADEAGMFYEQTVKGMYLKYFGDHYGNIIFEENKVVLSLVTPKHPYWNEADSEDVVNAFVEIKRTGEETLRELGWK